MKRDMTVDNFLIWRLQMEVNRQCKYALRALDGLHLGNEEDNSDFWFAMQAFLSAVANVSKLLWGSGYTEEEREAVFTRRRPLRESLGVQDDSPLRSRTFRNHFDHFDARLEKQITDWATSGFSGGISDTFVGDIDELEIGNLALRNFDTKTKTLTFRGQELALAPLFAHLVILQEKAVTAVRSFLLSNAIPVDELNESEDL